MAGSDRSFIGRGWGFPPTFHRKSGGGGVRISADEQDINESLAILLSTRLGERILEPEYGCNLDRYLFEPLDATRTAFLKELINDAILYHEPRIVLERIDLQASREAGRVDIVVEYRIPATNARNNLVYPFYTSGGPATP